MPEKADLWLYGINPVREALKARRRAVLEVFIGGGDRNRRLADLQDLLVGVPCREVPVRELDRKAGTRRHQGVLAHVQPFPWSDLEQVMGGCGPVLVLEGIQDPRNFGAIIRSSVALGVSGLIVEKRRSAPLSPVVCKAASGAVEYARICRVPNLPRAIKEMKSKGYWVAGTHDVAGTAIWAADLPEPLVVLVGGEGFGLRPVVAKTCDLWLTVPGVGEIKTLNASVAAGIILYELLRRKHSIHQD
jgi:23S rRNA (guanosine2251-2'-O)-methyltransferase